CSTLVTTHYHTQSPHRRLTILPPPFCEPPTSPQATGPEHVSSGRQCCLRPHVFPLRRQCRLYREPVCPLRNRSHGGRPRMAGVLRGAERHPRRRDDERRGAVMAAASPAPP